jgi:ribonucleoside-diphosphate reductase alpha chain
LIISDLKTLEKSIPVKGDGKIVERPQHMFMRVAIGIHKADIDSVILTYNLVKDVVYPCNTYLVLSRYTKAQMSSCFCSP